MEIKKRTSTNIVRDFKKRAEEIQKNEFNREAKLTKFMNKIKNNQKILSKFWSYTDNVWNRIMSERASDSSKKSSWLSRSMPFCSRSMLLPEWRRNPCCPGSRWGDGFHAGCLGLQLQCGFILFSRGCSDTQISNHSSPWSCLSSTSKSLSTWSSPRLPCRFASQIVHSDAYLMKITLNYLSTQIDSSF